MGIVNYVLNQVAKNQLAKPVEQPNVNLNVGIFNEQMGSIPQPRLLKKEIKGTVNTKDSEFKGELPIPTRKAGGQ